MMRRIQTCALVAMVSLGAYGALAQEMAQSELREMYNGARNMVGLARYCVENGYLTADSIEHAQASARKAAGLIQDKADGDDAEAQGAKGKIVIQGERFPISESELGEEQWCNNASQQGWEINHAD